MLAAREMLGKVKKTTFDLAEMDKQIRLASEKAATGILHIQEQRNLVFDELTKWTRMLAEARLRLHEMEAASLLKVLENVEHGLWVMFEDCWLKAGGKKR